MMQPVSNNSLRESEERLRLAFWAANIGFWTWDLLTNEVYLSPIWKSQLGYEDNELPNQFSTWENLLHPEDRDQSWKIIHEAQHDPQRVFEIYFRLKHKDGTFRWLLSRGRVYRDEAGKPVRIMGCHVDVTQQKEDERLLRESEARLRLVLDGGRMGMWVWDMRNDNTRWNQREYELLDLPGDKGPYSAAAFFQRLHPEDREKVQESIRSAVQQGRDFYDEFRVITGAGDTRWLAGAGRVLRDDSGAPAQMMGVNYDITEQKQAHVSIQEAHEFNKQIIAYAQEGIIVYDRECRYRLWNRYMEQLTGLKEEEVLGKRTVELFPFMANYDITTSLKRALQGETVTGPDIQYQSPVLKKSGWTTGRYGPLRNAQGEIIGIIGTVREITERKTNEKQLFDYQQRMELLLEQLPSILWTTDLELRFTSSKGSGLTTLNLHPNSVVGVTIQEFLQAQDGTHPSVEAHKKALTGESITYDQEFGNRFFHVHLEPLRDDGKTITGVIGIALDVTERKKQEEERRVLDQRIQQAQKLESLEVLAGGIAHDFNNLLTGMLGYANLAQAELPADSPVSAMIKEIEKAAQRAADLSRQMLAYSGKGKFVIEVIQLDELVVEMARLLKTLVEPKAQLKMVTKPALMEGDATQIRQVVMNLITNAADAIDHAGMITLRTGVRACSESDLHHTMVQTPLPTGDYAFLEVQDNGCGMTAEVVNKIFDPFFTTKFTGRGLGLASVLGIVRGHRGTISVESTPGKGTLFRVLFPVKTGAIAKIQAVEARKEAVAPLGTILVVEDDASVLSFVRHVLEKAGYHALTTTDSSQALTMMDQHGKELRGAIIDLTMPHLNGIDLSQQLRSKRASLPILIMSGYAEEDVAPRFIGMEHCSFLQKPFRAHDLTEAVSRMSAG